MDYLAFGLLAGSLIVIASFVVRDGLPHLAVIGPGSRLSRLSRAEAPLAWGRWCADAGLVLAGAGTCVLLITVAALLAGLSDSAGNLLVGLSIAVAVAASVLGVARLARRLSAETDAELRGEARQESRSTVAAPPVTIAAPAPSPVHTFGIDLPDTPASMAEDVWDDELPTWTPSAGPPVATRTEIDAVAPSLAAAPPDAHRQPVQPAPAVAVNEPARRARLSIRRRSGEPVEPVPEPHEDAAVSSPTSMPVPTQGSEQRTPVAGGVFSSPLLADIGLTPLDQAGEDGFRSPLLSNLDTEERMDEYLMGGSDLLIDEAPSPVQSTVRQREEIDNR